MTLIHIRRDRVFAYIARHYRLTLAVNRPAIFEMVHYGQISELRSISGTLNGRIVVVTDIAISRSIIAPWWHRDFIFQTAQFRKTLLQIDGEQSGSSN